MKILKINESNIAQYSIDGSTYKPITEIGKSEIYTLIREMLLDKDCCIEMDDPGTMTINNDAHKLIYAYLSGKLIDLKSKKESIFGAIRNEI